MNMEFLKKVCACWCKTDMVFGCWVVARWFSYSTKISSNWFCAVNVGPPLG